METVGARVTARFVNVAAVFKIATASVTPTAVRINVSEKVVFRAGTNIMGMDVTQTDIIENYYSCLNSKKYIYQISNLSHPLTFVSYSDMILVVT